MKTKNTISLLLLGSIVQTAFAEQQQKPNILVIISDDQGYGDYSSYKQGQVETPCLDKLTSESRFFSNFYVGTASAPTRASLLTGRSFVKSGVWSVHFGGDYIALYETILPQVLKKAGYYTALIGKWHSGKGSGYLPQYRGYDYVLPAVMHDHKDNDMTFNDVPMRLENHPYWKKMTYHGWTVDKMAKEACDFFDEKHDKPFFLQLAYVAPHAPWDAPKELIEKYRSRGQSPYFAALNALVEHMDSSIGQVMKHLDETGLSKNTIVLFFSDNGYVHNSPQYNLSEDEIRLRNPLNLSGTKGTIYEGGIWQPLCVRWPGKISPGKTDWLSHVTDILPTLADIAGLPLDSLPKNLDGKSFKKAIFDPNVQQGERIIFDAGMGIPAQGIKYNPPLGIGRDRNAEREKVSYQAAQLYARDKRFKLVKNGNRGTVLYDIVNDKGEKTDVSNKYPEDKQRLENALKVWFQDVISDQKTYRSPLYPIGLPPAGVMYFNGAAKFTGDMQGNGQWAHSIKASIASSSAIWNVKVVKAGEYNVYLQADATKGGAKVSLASTNDKVEKTILKGNLHLLGEIKIDSNCKQMSFTLEDPANGDITDFWNIVLESK